MTTPASRLTPEQRATATLVGDFLAVVLERVATQLGAADERRRQVAAANNRAFHDERRRAHRQLGPHERRAAQSTR